MSDAERRFHESWIGMVQPDGLVVSVPVLVDAQCMDRSKGKQLQPVLLDLCPPADGADGPRRIADLEALFSQLLGLTRDLWHQGEALPADL